MLYEKDSYPSVGLTRVLPLQPRIAPPSFISGHCSEELMLTPADLAITERLADEPSPEAQFSAKPAQPCS